MNPHEQLERRNLAANDAFPSRLVLQRQELWDEFSRLLDARIKPSDCDILDAAAQSFTEALSHAFGATAYDALKAAIEHTEAQALPTSVAPQCETMAHPVTSLLQRFQEYLVNPLP